LEELAAPASPLGTAGTRGDVRPIAGEPFGRWLLTVIAVGLAAYSV
jgi:hypothetical protein